MQDLKNIEDILKEASNEYNAITYGNIGISSTRDQYILDWTRHYATLLLGITGALLPLIKEGVDRVDFVERNFNSLQVTRAKRE
jgi:cytochrome b subunit of formate dehydrogenase